MVARDQGRRGRTVADPVAQRLAFRHAVTFAERDPLTQRVALPHRDGDGRGVRGRERHVVSSRLWDGRVRVLRGQPS